MSKPFIIESVNSADTIAAIFEDDGETGYLYLYDLNALEGEKIKGALQVYASREAKVSEREIKIIWAEDETKVGVLIEGKVWGLFDLTTGKNYQRYFKRGGVPDIPVDALEGF